MIKPIQNLSNINWKTKELIKEMFFSIKNESYPCYNSAMLLYRPILTHILNDLNGHNNFNLNYSEIIIEITKEILISNNLKNKMFKMKKIVNEINHKYNVILDKQINDVIECWNIIKEIVEIAY